MAAMPALNRSDELEKHGVSVSLARSKMAIASASVPATGLSMNTGLRALKHRPRLFEVGPAVDTLEEHDVDLRQQLVDRADDRDPELLAQLLECSRQRGRGWTGRRGCLRDKRPRRARRPARALGVAAFKSFVNATTCDVSRPMMPARRTFDVEPPWPSPAFASGLVDVDMIGRSTSNAKQIARTLTTYVLVFMLVTQWGSGTAEFSIQKSSTLRPVDATSWAGFL